MATKIMSVTVRGKSGNVYTFNFDGNKKYIEEWRQEGIIIDEICNTIPIWVVKLKLTKQWIFLQDLFNFNFKHLFK